MTSAVQGIKDKECLSSHRESGIQDKSWPQPSQGYRTMAGLSRLRDTGPGMASAVEGISSLADARASTSVHSKHNTKHKFYNYFWF